MQIYEKNDFSALWRRHFCVQNFSLYEIDLFFGVIECFWGICPGLLCPKHEIQSDYKNTSIRKILNDISNQSGLEFFYSNDDVNINMPIDIHVKNGTLDEVLSKIGNVTNWQCRVVDNIVIISKDSGVKTVQQTNRITGDVTNVDGEPVPGVSVVVKGTTHGTITDQNGHFSLVVPKEEAQFLVFSFVGMKSQEISITGKTIIHVKMEEDRVGVDEVVVVGYSTQRKATITGAISTITTKELKQSPTANLTNALAGRMPGLIVNQYSGGEPGVDESNIYVRGQSTYNNTDPIVIIDGVERSMSYLDPEEIETFTILKDASATAAYGIRGANGVIVITTKRGKSQGGKATVDFKASAGVNSPVKFPDYLGSADYATLYNEAILNDNPGVDESTLNLFSNDAIENFRKAKGDNSDGLGYNWDYFDYAFKPGVQQDYNLSINGGSDRARYYVLANYFSQTGNYKHTNDAGFDEQAIFKRYNFRSNIDIDITDNFYASLDISARITDRQAPGTTASRIVNICNTQPPFLPVTVEDNDDATTQVYRDENPYGMLFGDQIYRFNILGELSRTGYLDERNTYLNGSFILGHKLDFITKGLKAEGMFSYDASEGRWIQRTLSTYSSGYAVYPSYATFVPVDGRDVYMTPGHYGGEYETGNKYEIDQTIGNDFSQNSSNARTYIQVKLDYAHKFGLHDISAMLLGNRSKKQINNDVAYCYQGLSARATYDYADRYLFEFNAGYNGSENFAPGKRYGFFPAFSAGWVLSNEGFMKSTGNWLDNLKIRASVGWSGSDIMPNGDRFGYLQYYGSGSGYSFGTDNFGSGLSGLAEGDLANEDLSWEKSRKENIGIDATLFNRRLTLDINAFYEHRYDIITDLGNDYKVGVSDVVGKDASYVNSGIVNNHGIDCEIGWNGKIGRNFKYYIKPNFTFARNKIVYENEISFDYSWRQETGHPMNMPADYIFDHFVADQAEADELNAMNDGAGYQSWGTLIPGDVVYKDLDGDGQITDGHDRKRIGHPHTPEIMFGIPMGFQYKNFDFSMMFQGAASTSVQLTGPAVYDFPLYDQDKYGKVKKMHLKRWTPETASTAKYPALHYGANDNNKNGNSSLFLYNGRYIRLKTLEIGYTFPQRLIRFAEFQKVRVYAQGLNLLTFDGLDDVDVDPETASGDGSWYPIERVISAGIDVTF